MNPNEARQTATAIRRRLQQVSDMRQRDPNLVRIATDPSGDKIAFWYAQDGKELNYNVSAAQRKVNELAAQHGSDILKSRTGQIVKIDLPI